MNAGRLLLGAVIAAVYVFLMLPIVIVMVASVNSGKYLNFPIQGFSLQWYAKFFASQPFMDATWLSLKLGVVERIIWAWFLTLPVTAGLAWLLMRLAKGLWA